MGTNSMWGQPPRLTTDASGNTVLVGAGQTYPLLSPATIAPNSGFTKATEPLFNNLQATQPTFDKIFWWSVVKVDGFLPNPLGKYYAYFSTEHDTTVGGVGLAYSNSPLGPFTFYTGTFDGGSGANGSVFYDTRTTNVGPPPYSQTESPSVVMQADGTLRMFYQIIAATVNGTPAEGIQSTLSATSADGITWTIDNTFILDVAKSDRDAGNGGMTYFNPFVYKNNWYGYSLRGGGNYPHYVMHICNGELNDWTTDPRALGYHQDTCALLDPATPRNIIWPGCFVAEKNGSPYLFATISDFVSGGAVSSRILAMVKLSADLRTPTGLPVQIWEATLSWETGDIMSFNPYIEGNTLYAYYISRKNGVDSVGVIVHEL